MPSAGMPMAPFQHLTCLGACAMTTKFLDNTICTFKILLSWRFPRKQALLDDFPLCPQGPPPPQRETFIFIVVSPSLTGKYSSKPESAEISEKLPAMSDLCNLTCAFKTRSNLHCNIEKAGCTKVALSCLWISGSHV